MKLTITIDSDAGSAALRADRDFRAQDPLFRLDVMRDVLYTAQRLYDKALKDWNAELRAVGADAQMRAQVNACIGVGPGNE